MTSRSSRKPEISNGTNNRLVGVLDIILKLPRLTRIMIAAFFGVVVTAAIFPIVDRLYLTNFYSEATKILPSLVSAGAGLLVYLVGWILIVGVRGVQLPRRLLILIYILAGIMVSLFVIVLVANGYYTATLPDA